MKNTFINILFLFALVSGVNDSLYCQKVDSLIVAANPPGNLNNVINGDTTASGERINPNRIYVLKQKGVIDTSYFLTEEIRMKNLTLIGINNPQTGFPPVIQPAICEDGNSPKSFIEVEENGAVQIKNLYMLGTRMDGSSVANSAISARGDSVRYEIDQCIFENFGSAGTPNILNTWNALGSDIFITNSLFRNNQGDIPQYPGVNWAGPRVYAVDTMIVKNSTFFVLGGNIEGSGSSIGYLEFDHNTMFMQTKTSPFTMQQMCNAKITNNIFYSVYSTGIDSAHSYDNPILSSGPYLGMPAIIMLDSLHESLEGDPYYYIEANRNINAVNNSYFWPEAIINNFYTLNGDPKYQIVGGKIFAPIWATALPGAESILTDRDSWPGIDIYTNNDSLDPGFDAALVQAAADSMARFVKYVWANGGYGKGSRPFVYLSDPNNMFVGVPKNWAETQNYPVKENLRYSNQSLITAGTDGLPLGDINWFPEYIVNVQETQELLPKRFDLSQNYPNPFNPITSIEYQVISTDHVTLKVYDILGREISTLVNEQKSPGIYKVQFDASNLASGVYFYQLLAGDYVSTKKMILLK